MSIDIKDRIEVRYEDASISGTFLDIISVGVLGAEETLEQENHGWWCHLKDIITEVEHKELGNE